MALVWLRCVTPEEVLKRGANLTSLRQLQLRCATKVIFFEAPALRAHLLRQLSR
jgi:hypothetical protein